jgi:hypothetical protein
VGTSNVVLVSCCFGVRCFRAVVKRCARFGTLVGGYFEINVRFDETISASGALSLWLLDPLIANDNS